MDMYSIIVQAGIELVKGGDVVDTGGTNVTLAVFSVSETYAVCEISDWFLSYNALQKYLPPLNEGRV